MDDIRHEESIESMSMYGVKLLINGIGLQMVRKGLPQCVFGTKKSLKETFNVLLRAAFDLKDQYHRLNPYAHPFG